MVSIIGIVIPKSWDKEGNVTTVAIATRDEDEYLIEGRDQNMKLMPHLREEIEVSGVVKNRGKAKIFRLKHINFNKI